MNNKVQVVDDVAEAVDNIQKSLENIEGKNYQKERRKANISAEVGSFTDLDLVGENLLPDEQTRGTGFASVNIHSAYKRSTDRLDNTRFIDNALGSQWLRHLETSGYKNKHAGPYRSPGQDTEAASRSLAASRHRQAISPSLLIHSSKASYYLDDEPLKVDSMVDPFALPPFETAEKLLQVYMESCHNTFPFLAKKAFTSQFYQYYAALRRGHPYKPLPKWRATLNLVFAIGAVYAHLTSAEWCEGERGHLIYYSRATALGLRDPWLISHPDLPQMQLTALLSFYYLSIGRVSQAWTLIGLAMRIGYALGLHIRNEDRNVGVARKEVLYRIWWGHYSFELFVSATIGRATLGVNRNCSVPLPLPISSGDIEGSIIESRFGDQIMMSAGQSLRELSTPPEKQPGSSETISEMSTSFTERTNSGTYLKKIVRLFQITQDALHLYDAGMVSESWESSQKVIAQLEKDLAMWATSLPDGLDFFHRGAVIGHRYRREQNTLEILYHSTKILVTRPCLCRLDCISANPSTSSNNFNRQMAVTCVASAKAIANLLANEPEYHVVTLYEVYPWWSMVHHIMRSLVVLLLEVAHGPTDFPEDPQGIVSPLKGLMRWLRAMRKSNGMAKRAYSIVFKLVKKLAATISIDISDLLQEDEEINARVVKDPLSPAGRDTFTSNSHSDSRRKHIATGVTTRSQPETQAHARYEQYGTSSLPDFYWHQEHMHHAWQSGRSTDTLMDQSPAPWGATEVASTSLFFTRFDEHNHLLDLTGDGF
ncbi:fungal-specific transcription factor domain-containing protein [Pyrenochaeta sp. MPI-SDFR-AT-0127]|nr:fungal-specific transcription factor domain-containing protein [Pyrenochaeta sp. MPI-SDFR-AT-0127]